MIITGVAPIGYVFSWRRAPCWFKVRAHASFRVQRERSVICCNVFLKQLKRVGQQNLKKPTEIHQKWQNGAYAS